MKLDVLNIEGQSTGREITLPAEVFGVEPNEHAVYLAVKQYLANQRQGTHKAKERGEIKGSTRKIKRQKGTGTARAGSIKNPLFKGGGRVFGPRPRTYTIRLNKKVKALAKASALSSKASGGSIRILEDFTFDKPKTSELMSVLKNLDATDKKTLVVTAEKDNVLYLSGRNIPKAKVVTASNLNTYDIINSTNLLISEGSIEKLKEVFAK